MRIKDVDIAPRSDGRYAVWAQADYFELFKVERKVPIDLTEWIILEVCASEEAAKAFCKEKGLRIIPTVH